MLLVVLSVVLLVLLGFASGNVNLSQLVLGVAAVVVAVVVVVVVQLGVFLARRWFLLFLLHLAVGRLRV